MKKYELPEGWRNELVKDLVEIKKGKKVNLVDEPNEKSVPYIVIENLRGEPITHYTNDDNGVLCDSNDILIVWDGVNCGTVGKGISGFVGSTIARLRIKDNSVDNDYLSNFLKTKFKILKSNTTGSAIPHLNKNIFVNLKVPLPPLEDQQKIVRIIAKTKKLVDYRLKSDKLIDELLNSIFSQMFGNKNFEEGVLGDYTELISSGSTPKGGREVYLEEGEILFIRSQNVLMNKFSEHDALYLPLKIHEKMKRTWVKNKDVLLNITGASIGRTTIYEGENYKANVNQHVCIIRLKNFETLNPYYLTYYLSSPQMQEYIWRINAGATRQALNFSQIKKFKIPIPPIDVQNNFEKIVRRIIDLKDYQAQSKEEINNFFNNIVQKGFKGELVC